MITPHSFTAALAELELPNVFNPYRECCATHDRVDAAHIRRGNFERCLEAALEAHVDTIWIARDLGYRGGRRTGVPLTDEVHLNDASRLLRGGRLEKATTGPVVAERTAAVVWNMLSTIDEPAVLWNVFPLHPYEAGDPFSNRCHTRKERDIAWPFLTALIAMIKPRRIVAIGRDAGLALDGINVPVSTVRHPSYGGQADFISGLRKIYGLTATSRQGTTLELPF
ncbi:uracil-DNA glycosylase [Sinorhizobium medicae]|uniref:uracil-DNA glycosylase n=1 Tax=Sinorhizobium medicae TaxID=110321 RepID=UPI001F3753A1|nr:uracil-DNA glycosylase [Sinorhizobium medicae]